MNISVRNLSFGYSGKPIFNKLCAELDHKTLVILGPSGSGKTTLLKLMGGLLKPQEGEIGFSGIETEKAQGEIKTPKIAFMFQEPRLLPWLPVLENVSLPIEKIFGREEARERARYFLSLVSLNEKRTSYPRELSGGQAQRVSMARAFAWPAEALFMDEPFQSLDIPLRINLMDLTLSLLAREKHLVVAVTHEPREAVYIGERIMVIGQPGDGIVFDINVSLKSEDRSYGSLKAVGLEKEIIEYLGNNKLGVSYES